jgi:uncharacterized membrane protein YcaP (DUF421 family)
MDGSVFFRGFGPVGRTLLVGFLAHAALVLLLRLSGKRAIAKMNIFDFVVVVALGSTAGQHHRRLRMVCSAWCASTAPAATT